MKAFCYILLSEKIQKFYIGASKKDDVYERVHMHNTAYYGINKFTAKSNDWTLFLLIEADDYAHALRIEKKIKAMKSSKYIRNLLMYPEMVLKIIEETRLKN
jgi:putative endonuclease